MIAYALAASIFTVGSSLLLAGGAVLWARLEKRIQKKFR